MSTFNDGYDQAMPDAGSHFPHAGEHRPTHFLSILFDFWTGGGPFSISIAMHGYDKAMIRAMREIRSTSRPPANTPHWDATFGHPTAMPWLYWSTNKKKTNYGLCSKLGCLAKAWVQYGRGGKRKKNSISRIVIAPLGPCPHHMAACQSQRLFQKVGRACFIKEGVPQYQNTNHVSELSHSPSHFQ